MSARRLAWFAIAGQVVFVVSWIVAGALEPGYSHLDEGISALGAKDAAHAWIVDTGFVVLGLSIAALGPAALAVLPRRTSARVAAGLFIVAGIAMILIAAFPVDCSLTEPACKARFDAGELSWQTDVHVWLSLVFPLAFVLTPFALARALWPTPVAALSFSSGLTGVLLLAGSFLGEGDGRSGAGLAQRLGFIPVHLWALIIAVGVLHSTRDKSEPGPLVPVRPRDFFGRGWAGRGEVTASPAFLWRHFPLGIDFRRETRWLSDEAWVVDDTTTFDSGFVLARRMVCVMDGPDRVQVTADDMPGGAELVLSEGGYRVRPYKLHFPIGPIRFTLTCHDRVQEQPDGALDWTIDFRWHGLPAGRLSGLVRAVEKTPV
jgi:uncharacterized protein DUF998